MNTEDSEKLRKITEEGGYSERERELEEALDDDFDNEAKKTAGVVFNSLIIADFIKSDPQLLSDTITIFDKLNQHSQSVVGTGLRKVSVLMALGEIAGQFDFNCITNAWPSKDDHSVIPHHACDPSDQADAKAMTVCLMATGPGNEIDHARLLMRQIDAITRSVGNTRELYEPDRSLIARYTALAEEVTAYWWRLILRLSNYDSCWYYTHYSFLLAIGRVAGLELGNEDLFGPHKVVATSSEVEYLVTEAEVDFNQGDFYCIGCGKKQCEERGRHIYQLKVSRINEALNLTGNDQLRLS